VRVSDYLRNVDRVERRKTALLEYVLEAGRVLARVLSRLKAEREKGWSWGVSQNAAFARECWGRSKV
jgi:hypothetical protein